MTLPAKHTALIGPHGEVGEYLGPADHWDSPGAYLRRMAGVITVPASDIGTEWRPVPGRVVVHEHETGRWTTPIERWLVVVP